MSIMKEVHYVMRKDGESDKSFKKRFTTERSRQIDVNQTGEIAFLGGMGVRKWVLQARISVEAQRGKKIELSYHRT